MWMLMWILMMMLMLISGLAHLVEHSILQASELFPAEGFGQFLSGKGGSNNAFTASTYTNFHFDIPKEHFLDALDRSVTLILNIPQNTF